MNGAKKLGQAIRETAEDFLGTESEVARDASTVAELLKILARIVEGKSIDKAFGAPGDFGYGTPIGDGILAMLHDPAPPAPVQWIDPAKELPDDDTRVMIALTGHDELEFGYHSEEKWWKEQGFDGAPEEAAVYAWAHIPVCTIANPL